jgi:hypothetical protein
MYVKIVSDGTPCGTKVLREDGSEIEGVSGINWNIEVDQFAVARIEIGVAEIEVRGEAAFFTNPVDENRVKHWRRVKSIEFEDGEQISLMD